MLLGLALLGFASVYRSFEVVLFLQSYYLQMGPTVVYYGAAGGLVLSVAAGYLTFLGHRHLPYKRMLIATGVLLTGVLFVMVGEEINELQLAGWIGTTNIPGLQGIPDWAGLWFSIFPNVETFLGQAVALLLVGGAYFISRTQDVEADRRRPGPRRCGRPFATQRGGRGQHGAKLHAAPKNA